jgi:NitT/TauT family transport system substrate-binding protein
VDTVADLLWVTKPDAPYNSIKDLKGKKIGYSRPGSVTNMLILMALQSAGMSPDDVELVATGGSGSTLTAVLQGAVAAGWFAEPLWSKDKDEVKPVFWVKDVMPPNMVQTVGITTRDFAESHPDKIRAIIAARRKGVQYIYKHPDEAAKITAKAYDSDNVDLYKSVFHHFKKIHYWNEGAFDYKALDRMVRGLKIVGKIKHKVDWTKIVDQSFLPKDLQHKNQ